MTPQKSSHADGPDWTAPGAFEVVPGVYRIPLPLPNDGLRAVNVYAVIGGDDLVLVDSGWAVAGARDVLAAALGTLDRSLGDIRRFLVTHVHRDHYSQAVVLRRDFGGHVALGAGERASLDVITGPGHRPLGPQLGQLDAYGASSLARELQALLEAGGPMTRNDWEAPDQWLSDGDTATAGGRELQVVETPGHTRGHVVFHDAAASLLFAGDHVLPAITPSIGFEPALSPDPLGAFLGSLARVRQLPDAMVLPAHGPVAPSVHRRVDELVEHHGRRLEQTEAAVASGADTVADVAGRLRWTRRERRLGELDLFNQMLAVTETGAHLGLLAAQGRVVRVTDEHGVYRFAVPG